MPFIRFRLSSLFILFLLCIGISCSSEDVGAIEGSNPDDEDVVVNNPPDNMDDTNMDDDDTMSTDDDRFFFDNFLVMEHSYNTGGCTPGPCDTIDTSLSDVFNSGQPDDPFFFRAENGIDLNLKCLPDEGRRAEFKQVSDCLLYTSPSPRD